MTGAFGDNLDQSAAACARTIDLSESDQASLKELGICLNYNGYGVSLADLYFPPAELFRQVQPCSSPFDFLRTDSFKVLREGYAADMDQAASLEPELNLPHAAVFLLPAAPWANRVSGVFGNELALQYPDRAHAMVTRLEGGITASVFVPR